MGLSGLETVISVVICSHNRVAMLRESIHSVLASGSERDDFELLIVDNASTDGTAQMVESLSRQHPQVRYLYERELGLSKARNLGIQQSLGQLVVFLDDDAVVSKTWLYDISSPLTGSENLVGVGGRIEPVFPAATPMWVTPMSLRFYGSYDLGPDPLLTEWVPGGNSAWSRAWLVGKGGFDERLGRVGKSPIGGSEESLVCATALQEGKQLLYEPRALMFHQIEKRKTRLSWLIARYFGQGIMGIRMAEIKSGKAITNAPLRRGLIDLVRDSVRRIVQRRSILSSGLGGLFEVGFELVVTFGRIYAMISGRLQGNRVPRARPRGLH